jgi:DNA-directed RNA polymerase specialized sigma24 family protein
MKRRRRSKQVATTHQATELDAAKVESPHVPGDLFNPGSDGAASVAAVTDVLQALTVLPTDRAKARVLRFVQDYFDEQHGH